MEENRPPDVLYRWSILFYFASERLIDDHARTSTKPMQPTKKSKKKSNFFCLYILDIFIKLMHKMDGQTMYYNKLLQVRISKELLLFLERNSKNTSRFIRSLIRSEMEKRSKKNEEDRNITPEIRAKTPYTFLAKLIRVIDGDTILINAQLGFYVNAEVKLRLSGINAQGPETPTGKKAIEFLKQRLSKNNLVVESRKKGKYGRYIGFVYYHRTYKKFEEILRHGKVINEELIKSGLVEKYFE